MAKAYSRKVKNGERSEEDISLPKDAQLLIFKMFAKKWMFMGWEVEKSLNLIYCFIFHRMEPI